ncbi:hypothetical protein B9Z19DRAFT_1124948 [Tuber borchii]|uniref:NAD(P)-binding protein n=1 Tax=Tuber borchii TaxID=42251 RepID=A0A2T6ZVS9_TUBBO|nr:hypothetical protein B9Z19DRAFT_1124948 [Tuber borchii]
MISLKDKNVLITRGSRGLGAAAAHAFRKGRCKHLGKLYQRRSQRRQCNSRNCRQARGQGGYRKGRYWCRRELREDSDKCIALFGSVDVIISNVGWMKISDFGDLNALSEAEWDKCWAVNIKANLHLLRAASESFNANPDGGSFLISSSTAAITPSGSAMAYSVTKAAGLHLMPCLAQTQGLKIRVNAVLPGLLLTDLGEQVQGREN